MDGIDGPDLARALAALEAASDFAVDRLCTDPAWDLVYCDLGLAILAIQACTDEAPAEDPDHNLDGGLAAPPGVAACVSWVEDAARVLRRVQLGSRPGLAAAVTAVADVQAALRHMAA